MLPVQYLVTPKVIETISLQENVHDFFKKQNPYRRYVVNAILIKDILQKKAQFLTTSHHQPFLLILLTREIKFAFDRC